VKKFKWIIAKEGLILIGLAMILYVALLFLGNIPAVYPKYRLEFENGEVRTINISPEIRNDFDYKRLLREVHNPTPALINKRVEEYRQMEKIKSPLKAALRINSTRLYISELFSSLLSVMFIFKLLAIYAIILFIRFIIWALKALKEKKWA